jgi:hypothetical protein
VPHAPGGAISGRLVERCRNVIQLTSINKTTKMMNRFIWIPSLNDQAEFAQKLGVSAFSLPLRGHMAIHDCACSSSS